MGEAIDALIIAYRNEKSTDEILPFATELFEYLKTRFTSRLKAKSESEHKIVVESIIEQEEERIKYFMKEYLMERIKKINTNYKLNKEFLSEEENRYFEGIVEIYKKEDLIQETEWVNDEFIGFYSLITDKRVVLDGNSVELQYGDFFVCQLKDVLDLLYKDEIYLL